MPKQKSRLHGTSSAGAAESINDPRFANFATDPRFRLPSKKHSRTTIDKRFSRMLKDDEFVNTAKVDRYGRRISGDVKRKALKKLYVPEDEEDGDEDSEDGGVEVEVEDDDVIRKELKKADAIYDPARGGGFSSSEDDSEDEDEEAEDEKVEEATFPDMQAEQEGVEMGEVSSRLAVVNMDWDNIRAADLMAVFSSFVRPGGKIQKISVYQSEFGKERMEREELEGPPKEIFTKKQEQEEEWEDESDGDSDRSEDDEELEEQIKKDLLKADDGEEFDSAALRQYQLERLRYYYAVIICSDKDTAQQIYESTDGTEYLSSANFFDLRFIPDDVEFDDKPRDECDTVPAGYRPTEFVTDALQHSKVKLTWDTTPDDVIRKEAIKKAFSGSRAEIGENDLRAYLGSDSEDDEEEEVIPEVAETDRTSKLTKKELARQKMRAALGLTEELLSTKSQGPVGDMEITFTAGLSSKEKGGVFENEPLQEETTAEKYIRKEKERKARRKERAKALREGRDPDAPAESTIQDQDNGNDDLGFDDPFFTTDPAEKAKAAKATRKEERRKKREVKEAEAEAQAAERAELELLMADNSTETAPHLDHFDINEIQRAEKAKRRKHRGRNKSDEAEVSRRGGLQENFELDVNDERFTNLFENHEFAIDPSNPKFKPTEGMKKLLEEGRRKRAGEALAEEAEDDSRKKRKPDGKGSRNEGLSGLIEKVKKRSKE
ncbi:pre-rRNA-processing protein-like protein ESF1 [Xylogone sp. PMI_703]|nr:pre-rRNA-processing protein-like protein ESF1 [Xylogone sp. PMI_703]